MKSFVFIFLFPLVQFVYSQNKCRIEILEGAFICTGYPEGNETYEYYFPFFNKKVDFFFFENYTIGDLRKSQMLFSDFLNRNSKYFIKMNLISDGNFEKFKEMGFSDSLANLSLGTVMLHKSLLNLKNKRSVIFKGKLKVLVVDYPNCIDCKIWRSKVNLITQTEYPKTYITKCYPILDGTESFEILEILSE